MEPVVAGTTSVKESMHAPLWVTSTGFFTSILRRFDSHATEV